MIDVKKRIDLWNVIDTFFLENHPVLTELARVHAVNCVFHEVIIDARAEKEVPTKQTEIKDYEPATEKQLQLMKKLKIPLIENMSKETASNSIAGVLKNK